MRRLAGLGGALAAGAIGLLLALTEPASASPAAPTLRSITQPDGTSFSARLYGDEHVNGVETAAGYTVVERADGTWVFARQDGAGRLVPTGLPARGEGSPPAGAELGPHLRDEPALEAAAEERIEAAEGTPATTPPATGTQDVLVVLVEFTDQALATSAADWADLFFGPDQSVADYYADASFGALDLVPAPETQGTVDDGVVVVSLPRTHPDSANNYGLFAPVARQAIQAAGATVDFAAHDDDASGSLSPDELHVGLVLAGTEAAQGCASPTLWAHRGSLGTPATVDGVTVGDEEVNGGYFSGGELQCPNGPLQQATVGIWVHEFGHDIGWNDLYDLDGSSAGVDAWSVMGSHWQALDGEPIGTRPPLPDPFHRMQVGWLTPTVVSAPSDDVAVASAAATGEALQVGDNPDGVDIGFLGGGGTGEYFLVENRRPEGYDVALPGCGALVWHIDESAFSNADDEARLVDVEEAGEGWRQSGFADSEDPYPSELPFNDAFGPATSPSSMLNTGLPSGTSLTDFSAACGPSITLDVHPGPGATTRPVNNHFADSHLVRFTPYDSHATRVLRGNNLRATRQAGEPAHAGIPARSSVWWTVLAPRSGHVTVTSSSTFQEVIGVYTGPAPGRLRRVESARGVPSGAGAGSPQGGPESVYAGLGFRVQRGVRYHLAVDSRVPGRTGGIRLLLDYDQAPLDVRPVRARTAPGEHPLLRIRIRNTSGNDRLRVYDLVEGTNALDAVDCPRAFVLAPGQVRTCLAPSRSSGARGTVLRGRVDAWIQWLDRQYYSTVGDPWFARVRR